MGFREAIDLSDILVSYREYLGDYESTAAINFVDPGRRAPDPFEEHGAIPARLQAPRSTKPVIPTRIGNGPPTCSTRTTLVSARPTFSWDVNGWYRTIGVPWPYVRATSGVLSRSYVASGGQRSARATYYLRRLLNRPVRGAYDTWPLGEQFLDDEYVQDEMKARAQAEASRRSRGGSYTKASAVLDEWGYDLKEDDEGVVDNDLELVHDESTPETDTFEPVEWTFSYWLWDTFGDGGTSRLEQWQTALVSVLSRSGHHLDLAVGLCGNMPDAFRVAEVDGYRVVFLRDTEQVTEALAVQAAEALTQHPNTPPSTY